MGVQRGEAGPTNQSPRGFEFGNALARGGQLFLQLGDARLQLPDHGLSAAVLAGGHARGALLGFLHPCRRRPLAPEQDGIVEIAALGIAQPDAFAAITNVAGIEEDNPAESLLGRADCSGNRWLPQTTCTDCA